MRQFLDSAQVDPSLSVCSADQHLDALYRFVAREIRYRERLGNLLAGELAPEDVVGEVLLRMLDGLARIPRSASFGGYLRYLALSIIRGAAQESAERRRPERIPLEQPVSSSCDDHEGDTLGLLLWREVMPDRTQPPLDEYLFDATREVLEGALNRLPNEQRLVFILHAVEGLDYQETAAIMARPESCVKQLYRAAREVLRAWLAGKVDDWVSGSSQPHTRSTTR
jgi:RNA polymerase sigma factor (sigma-70 family)